MHAQKLNIITLNAAVSDIWECDTHGDTERTNCSDTTPEACQIFGARDRTTQTTPERTSKLMDT